MFVFLSRYVMFNILYKVFIYIYMCVCVCVEVNKISFYEMFKLSVLLLQAVDEPDIYETDELPEAEQAQEGVSETV